MKTLLVLFASILFAGTALAASPSSINNDDSCDIKVGPAATLLLPYFEVDVNGTSGRTTLFTITNVSRYPQIAHVTLWSDWSYPLLTFNLFFTGYDIQAINLADVLIRGTIATPSGTTPSTPGSFSSTSDGNLRTPIDCGGSPAVLPASITAELRRALTLGIYTPPGRTCSTAGDNHANASGYATIDVVAGCTNRTPEDPLYYTSDLLFDNVLIGDYQQIGRVPRTHSRARSTLPATPWSIFARSLKVAVQARSPARPCRTLFTIALPLPQRGRSIAVSLCRRSSRRATSREARPRSRRI